VAERGLSNVLSRTYSAALALTATVPGRWCSQTISGSLKNGWQPSVSVETIRVSLIYPILIDGAFPGNTARTR